METNKERERTMNTKSKSEIKSENNTAEMKEIFEHMGEKAHSLEVLAHMGEKLQAAGKKAEKATAARRERQVKGSHLLTPMTELARKGGFTVQEKSGFLKVTGTCKGRSVYLARKGGRVDFSGFTVSNGPVKQITEQEAKEKHLGKVRAQIDFETASDDAALGIYNTALAELNAVLPEAEKPAKVEKAPKAPKAPKAAKAASAPTAGTSTETAVGTP